MMLSWLRPADVVAAMVARHRDAELIGAALAEVGVELIRGAGAGGQQKDRGGAYALRASLRALEGGASLVMTADVPPGPGAPRRLRHHRAGAPLPAVRSTPWPPPARASRCSTPGAGSPSTCPSPARVRWRRADPGASQRDAGGWSACASNSNGLEAATLRAYLAGADVQRILAGRAARTGPPARPGLALEATAAPATCCGPLAPALLRLRERNGKEDTSRRSERLGIASAPRPEGQARMAARRQRRRDQCGPAADRGARRRAAGAEFPADDGHGDLGGPRAAAARPSRRPPVRAARRRATRARSWRIGGPTSPCSPSPRSGRT